jgi:Fe-S cluster assembly protein SufD
VSALLESLAEGFATLPSARIEAQGLGELRRQALRQSLAAGLPTQRAENWKYTALRALGARRFAVSADSQPVDADALAHVPAPRLVFVNGKHDVALSQSSPVAGVDVATMSTLANQPAVGAPPPDGGAERVFGHLNVALAIEGAVVDVAPGVDAGLLHLVFVSTPATDDLAVHLSHRVTIGDGAVLRLVEHHLATGAHQHLLNHRLDVRLGANASLLHARLQDEDAGASLVAHTEASVGANAQYRRADVELGAGLSRHELAVILAGAGARCDSGGVLMADARRHLDTRLSVLHAGRDTTCDLRWRGLADDRARVAFLGAITIAQGADGSDASLSCKNLLLSPGAEIDAQPVLEIHADEVKAAHGATVGRLDPTALFYLRSRGVPEAEARSLLTQAFCREALRPLADDQVLALVSPRLESRLPAAESAA